jgi:hypothetical protein
MGSRVLLLSSVVQMPLLLEQGGLPNVPFLVMDFTSLFTGRIACSRSPCIVCHCMYPYALISSVRASRGCWLSVNLR